MAEATHHKLLVRQLRRFFGGNAPEGHEEFISAVNEAYQQADQDRQLLERSLELTSQELMLRNERLRGELKEKRQTQKNLEHELGVRRKAEEALRRSMVRLNQAQRIAGVGYWEWNLETGKAVWSEETYRIFGYQPGTVEPSHELFLERCDVDDITVLSDALTNASPGNPQQVEFHITTPDGKKRTLRASGEPIIDDAGQPTQVFGVCFDITEQRAEEHALVEAKEQAELAHEEAEKTLRLKTSLLNNISHELRTPLTSILGYAEILNEDLEDEQQEFAEFIVVSSKRLMQTFNSVLTLAQLEGGAALIELGVHDIVAEARENVALYGKRAEEKNVAMRVQSSAPRVWARIDRPAFHRTLSNLLDNALKFTDSGEIIVDIGYATSNQGVGSDAVMSVRDTGVGIHPDFLPRLFNEFEQQSDGDGRKHEGVGLGLSITKRLVEMMDGRIEVESALTVGTSFSVYFPSTRPNEGEETESPLSVSSEIGQRPKRNSHPVPSSFV